MHATPRKNTKHSANGFTLLEVLIAIVVLSFAMLAMATLVTSIMSYNKFADHVTKATTLAEDKLEEFRNADFYDIASSAVNETVDTYYTRYWDVYAAEPPGIGDAKTIYVTVEFDWQNSTHKVELSTIIIK